MFEIRPPCGVNRITMTKRLISFSAARRERMVGMRARVDGVFKGERVGGVRIKNCDSERK